MLNGDCWVIKKKRRPYIFKIPSLKLINPIFSFGLVGGVGFVVDAFLLTVLTVELDLDALPSRGVSFTCATLITWLLNRTFTFSRQVRRKTQARNKEYFMYLAVQVIGATLNFIIFIELINWNPMLRKIPVVPLAAGAIVALLFNFTMSQRFVFGNQGGLDE
jgi:putative flippase GtrA